jgi:hypothetical protein
MYSKFTVTLGFEPNGSMLWMRQLPLANEVWLVFVFGESHDDSDTEHNEMI